MSELELAAELLGAFLAGAATALAATLLVARRMLRRKLGPLADLLTGPPEPPTIPPHSFSA